ncbi:ABC transporter substrate-binding protein [Gandjariella thermophila]|uniref:Branched-chain amino acid ABC transporter substrate-binding protein n=1 Tax=Gandjariella thermophila TaxID=1931992 RepID=A0A4D4J3N6_9PSEU|nr:ABC transporter substrate-binding protein [Gandjariella thermophila]GDY29692.1 branched-chain amino acid ABC transporter substrate-binding protein [Gandjariella thermophila]
MRLSLPRALAAGVMALVALTTGCAGTDGNVLTGPGVTADTISLGVLGDLSGPFAPLGKNLMQGNQLYFDKVNAAGGICGRQVRLVVADHGYNAQRAIDLYSQVEPKVLGFVQLLGSPMTDALKQDILQDQVLAAPAGWSSWLLRHPYLMVTGTTYDLEMVNGLDYLVNQGGVTRGDAVGHVYLDGDYGGNALQGSTFAAGQLGLSLVPVKVDEKTRDMTAQLATLKAQRVKAILASVTPAQTVAIATAARAAGLDVPILSDNPGFDPAILRTQMAPWLEQKLLMVSSYAPFGADIPAARDLAAAFRARYPSDAPSAAVDYGYAVANAYGEILATACANKDLTREGVHRAFRSQHTIDTGGLNPLLHFSDAGKPSADAVYVLRPDSHVPGGLAIVKNLFVSALASRYEIAAL